MTLFEKEAKSNSEIAYCKNPKKARIRLDCMLDPVSNLIKYMSTWKTLKRMFVKRS